MEPKFSIIIPVYNAAATLAETVESIAVQVGPVDWECILIDDGSTDESPALCDRLGEKYPWVRAFHTSNGGPSAARNRGIQEAAGEWLLFLDSDDEWPENALSSLRPRLEQYPEISWFICDYRNRTPEGERKPPVRGWQTVKILSGPTFAARVEEFKAVGSMAVWQYCLRRRSVLESGVRFIPGIHWAEDKLFSLELLAKTERVALLPVVLLYYHCDRPGSLANSNIPRHLAGAVALWERMEPMFPAPADNLAAREMAAEVFWPCARAAAGGDKALRDACLPLIRQARPLYIRCSQSVGNPAWVLFRWMLILLGPDLGFRLAGLLRHT